MSSKDHVFTLGIEEEFQIVDPVTRDLRSHVQQLLDYALGHTVDRLTGATASRQT